MLQVTSQLGLDGVESVLRSAAQRHGAQIVSVTRLGHLMRDKEAKAPLDAIVFTVFQPELSVALLAADMRFAAFLPCRIAAFERGEAVVLEAVPPLEACRMLNRPDLDRLALLMETTLAEIMHEATQAAPAAVQSPTPVSRGVGATEEQVHVRGMVPQRIDRHGTKIEEIAGTGKHDSPGG